jgi:hypothetical protein
MPNNQKMNKGEWEKWKNNFCNHISDWSFNTAFDELGRMKEIVRQQALEEGKKMGREELMTNLFN